VTQPYYHDRPQFGGPSKPKRRAWPWVLAAVLGMCLLGSAIAAVSGGTAKPAPTKGADIARAVQSPAPKAKASTGAQPTADDPLAGVFQAGSYEVGKASDPGDGTIKPGTFLLATTDHCYWERVKSFDGDFDSIIANGNLDVGETVRVTVKKSDEGINLKGDCVMGQKGGLK
jgi:hypothetical protein